MNKHVRSTNPILNIANIALVHLPSPSSVSGWWKFGSLLGICLIQQILTGIFLAIHYWLKTEIAFSRISHIWRDENEGWQLRTLHAHGASQFFICLYLHIGRNIYYGS